MSNQILTNGNIGQNVINTFSGKWTLTFQYESIFSHISTRISLNVPLINFSHCLLINAKKRWRNIFGLQFPPTRLAMISQSISSLFLIFSSISSCNTFRLSSFCIKWWSLLFDEDVLSISVLKSVDKWNFHLFLQVIAFRVPSFSATSSQSICNSSIFHFWM